MISDQTKRTLEMLPEWEVDKHVLAREDFNVYNLIVACEELAAELEKEKRLRQEYQDTAAVCEPSCQAYAQNEQRIREVAEKWPHDQTCPNEYPIWKPYSNARCHRCAILALLGKEETK